MNGLVVLYTFAIFVISVKGEVSCPATNPDDPIYLAHETECGKFYECSSGSPVLFQCPEGTYFDSKLSVCNWNVDCGSLATSTPSPKTTSLVEE